MFGQVHPVFLHIYDPDILVSNGHSALCDQISFLLIELALKQGIQARHVGLNGHVVMEAWYDNDWHMLDPDYEVIPYDQNGKILNVEELAKNQTVLYEIYASPEVISSVESRNDNSYISYPIGARFVWTANLLAYIERIMEILKFAIPALFVIIGVMVRNL